MTSFPPRVRAVIKSRSGGICEKCGRAPGAEIHHRRPRGMGGTSLAWVNKCANGLHLCAACHNYIERHARHWSQVNGWLVSQHGTVLPVDVPVTYRGRQASLTNAGAVLFLEEAA